ncbi:hypothetical protein ACTMTJ_29900 [Phytohabitans sp. LJ34]
MHPRRGFNDRLQEGIQIDGGDVADLIYGLIRWLIAALVSAWLS